MVLKFAAKPASRILVNTGGSQGGTGISTGLNIAFTLGCGTCGGSSVSENVSPMQLINIKKVAYGLKDCTTLMEDDKTFHPEMAAPVQAAGSVSVGSAPVSPAPTVCGPCRGNMSPAAIVAAFDARNNSADTCADMSASSGVADTSAGTAAGMAAGMAASCENEKLAALVRQLITTMKNQKDA